MTGSRDSGDQRGLALYEWINRHAWAVAAVLVVLAVVLAGFFPVLADASEPSFDPKGEIYDTRYRAEEVFETSSPIRGVSFIVENPNGGDVLTRDSLLELKQNEDAVRADAESQTYLASSFDRELGFTVDGIFSFADAVDAALPNGLAGATEPEVKATIAALLADDAPTSSLRFLLSTTSTTRDPTTIGDETIVLWESPAFFSRLLYDVSRFDADETVESFGDDTNLAAERWLRGVETELRGASQNVTVLGLAIDFGLVSEEQNGAAGPFIFYAIAFIVIFVGALLRSYWAAMFVGAGLGVTMMLYNGVNALIGLKTGSPLLIMIVPIALISFGVDFFIHGGGRAREMQVKGHSRERAYPLGMSAVSAALLLAALTSAAAFLSNSVSGIPAIIEFGIAGAAGLLLAYMILGWICPKLLLSMEERLGPRPADLSHTRTVLQKLGFLAAAFIAGIAVTMAIVFPAIGWALFLAFLGLFIYVPYRLTARRNRRAADAGRPLTDEVRGAGHGFKAAGSVVHFLARWRVFTVPAVAVLAVLGIAGAAQVERGFEIKDFFSSNTNFVKSLDKLEQYYGSSSGGLDFIFLEGDLTSPDTLLAMEGAEREIDASTAEFSRDFNGDVVFQPSAATVVRLATASTPMREAILGARGIAITDTNGDGLADDANQIGAIYDYVKTNEIVNDDGIPVFRPDQTEGFLYIGDGTQATMIGVSIATITDDQIILDAKRVLDDAADSVRAAVGPGVTVAVTGSAITGQDALDAFVQSMLTSLPVAIALTSLLVFVTLFFIFRHFGRRMASVLKRSGRYAVISIVPVLLVVAWIYGFMYLVGYRINVITATIAAISIGVGVDYATHFTVRFIEEFEHEPSRFPALRRAGEGTGGALAISAMTSITGFLVMATAPMPMFQTFGVLTAMMIVFSLLVTLLVLPSLLLLITPSRKGEERELLIAEITQGGEFEYEPHSRETALRGDPDL